MKNVIALALVATIAGSLQAQVQTTTEQTVETRSSANGAVQATTEKTTVKSDAVYVNRLNEAYKYAGVPEADVVRLRDIDTRYIEARRVNPKVPVDTYYTQQTKILQPAQVEKVRTYLKEHPAPAGVPAHVVTTYETVPSRTGVEVNTPLGSIGVGVNTGDKVVERKEVVPAQ